MFPCLCLIATGRHRSDAIETIAVSFLCNFFANILTKLIEEEQTMRTSNRAKTKRRISLLDFIKNHDMMHEWQINKNNCDAGDGVRVRLCPRMLLILNHLASDVFPFEVTD